MPSRIIPTLVGAVALTAYLVGTPSAQEPSTQPRLGTVERITVHGKSLEGNLIGDSADRQVVVYLPPSYATSGRG